MNKLPLYPTLIPFKMTKCPLMSYKWSWGLHLVLQKQIRSYMHGFYHIIFIYFFNWDSAKYTLTLKRRDAFYQVVALVLISTIVPGQADDIQQIYILKYTALTVIR